MGAGGGGRGSLPLPSLPPNPKVEHPCQGLTQAHFLRQSKKPRAASGRTLKEPRTRSQRANRHEQTVPWPLTPIEWMGQEKSTLLICHQNGPTPKNPKWSRNLGSKCNTVYPKNHGSRVLSESLEKPRHIQPRKARKKGEKRSQSLGCSIPSGSPPKESCRTRCGFGGRTKRNHLRNFRETS